MRPIVINLKIANRIYPVKITSEEQDKSMRKAAHLINIKIEKYHEKYEVKDIQDVLSMICLDANHHYNFLQIPLNLNYMLYPVYIF